MAGLEGNVLEGGEEEGKRFRLLGIGDRPFHARLAAELGPDFEVETVAAEAAFQAGTGVQAASFDAVLVDAALLPRSTRSEALRSTLGRLLEIEPGAKVIVLLGTNDAEAEAAALVAGAWDVAPVGEGPPLAARLRAAGALRRIERDGGSGTQAPPEWIGTSGPMRRVLSRLRRAASGDAPVLIAGASGAGKQLAALAIHEWSPRALGVFVSVGCAALSEARLEKELSGAASDASPASAPGGKAEEAPGRTLLLDEIGFLSPALQRKLARFLAEHGVEGPGERRRRSPAVRVVAATSRDLEPWVRQGRFREDLHRRLAANGIELPPLRERAEDLLLMARLYLDRYAREASRPLRGFAPGAVEALWRWSWPGNVRELIHRIRGAVVLAEGPFVSALDLGLPPDPSLAPVLPLRESLARAEIDALLLALDRAQGNKVRAARALGISRSTLYELLSRHGLG